MKNADLIFLDLFAGIGGFHKGLADAGFNFSKVYFSEIDRHAIANYKYHFNEAEYIGGVESILTSGMERPNIITFGSPCQDFSLAGKRAGLDGNRSSLIEYALSAISHYRPDIFIWENVKGTFSSNNRQDFWSIIQAFANIGGYGLEWQFVNTSWLLPQNRERIYLVGHLATSFRDWKGIFPIEENDGFSNQTKRGKLLSPKLCTTITATTHKMHSHDTYITSRGHGFVKDSVNDICPTIRGSSFEHNTSVLSYTRDCKGKIQNYHTKDICNTVHSATSGGGNTDQFIKDKSRIRRLTEIECERLQGFEDNHTKFGLYPSNKINRYIFGSNRIWEPQATIDRLLVHAVKNYKLTAKKTVKTQRYKMIGNAVTATMVERIGSRIIKNYKHESKTNDNRTSAPCHIAV